MKAVVIRRYGGPEVLEYADVPEPAVGAGEALVQVAAAGINPIDIMERSGLTKDFHPLEFPYVPGWDLSGTVVRLGLGVTDVSPGDKGPGLGVAHLRRVVRGQGGPPCQGP